MLEFAAREVPTMARKCPECKVDVIAAHKYRFVSHQKRQPQTCRFDWNPCPARAGICPEVRLGETSR
jgi:hypothetical protein